MSYILNYTVISLVATKKIKTEVWKKKQNCHYNKMPLSAHDYDDDLHQNIITESKKSNCCNKYQGSEGS